jgi:hypothetical protein
MKPTICRRMRPTRSASRTAKTIPVDQGRALGGHDVALNEVTDVARMLVPGADKRRQDGRCENSDAVGAEILQEPRDRGQDGSSEVSSPEQGGPVATALMADRDGLRTMQHDLFRVARLARQEPLGCRRGLLDPPAEYEPGRALHDEKPADDDRHGKHDRTGVHPAPSPDVGVLIEDQEADGGARQAPDGLEAERAQHHAPADAARHAFGNDQVGGGIVASQRDADAHQRDHDDEVGRAERQQRDEDCEEHHLDDEHLLAAIAISEAAERGGTDQDAEQRRRGDDAFLRRAQGELFRHQRERHSGGEDHHALEELAGSGEPPDEPLHVGQRGVIHRRRIRPDRRLVDVLLDGLAG